MGLNTLDDILDECLDLLDRGATIEEAVALFPEHAAQLRAQLGTIDVLRTAYVRIAPSDAGENLGRNKLSAFIRDAHVSSSQQIASRDHGTRWPRLALVPQAMPAIVAMFLLGGAAWSVAASTDLTPSFSPFQGDEESVQVQGAISAIDGHQITIITLLQGTKTAVVTAETKFVRSDGVPLDGKLEDLAVGAGVKVFAIEANDHLIVSRIELQPPAQIIPAPHSQPAPPSAPVPTEDIDDARRRDDAAADEDDNEGDEAGDESPDEGGGGEGGQVDGNGRGEGGQADGNGRGDGGGNRDRNEGRGRSDNGDSEDD